jgi:phosphate transport system protein
MTYGHIVKSYDEDLKNLNAKLFEMAELAGKQLEQAVACLIESDDARAVQIIGQDPIVDALEHDIDAFAIRMIALRQPVAKDLRNIVAVLKISSHLERVADYARNIAKRALELKAMPQTQGAKALSRLVKTAIGMMQDVMTAYESGDVVLAMDVWQRDLELDEMYTSYLREILTYMMEDSRQIGPCTQLLFAAKNIERAGDHAADIAEIVHYYVEGTPFKDPKSGH